MPVQGIDIRVLQPAPVDSRPPVRGCLGALIVISLLVGGCSFTSETVQSSSGALGVSTVIPNDPALDPALGLHTLDSLVLVEINRFGQLTSVVPIGPSAAAATPGSVSPFLAMPRMAVPEPGSGTLVLDPVQRAVFRFDEQHSPLGFIGGNGEGPGEFVGPVSLDVGADGRVGVVDLALRRVTVFTPDGALLYSIRLDANAIALVLHDSVFDVLAEFGREGSAVRRYRYSGEQVDDLVAPTADDRSMARAAIVGWAARGFIPDQTVYFNARPGTFRLVRSSEDNERPRGMDLFPEFGFRQMDNGQSVPLSYAEAGTLSGGVMSDGQTVFIGYYFGLVAAGDGRTLNTPKWGVAAFDSTGALIAKGTLSEAWGRVQGVTPGPNGTLLIAVSSPEPAVVIARLQRTTRTLQ
jgi:hypothetical protein